MPDTTTQSTTETTTEVVAPAPEKPAAPEPAATAEKPSPTVSKAEHDAAMAKMRLENKELAEKAKRADALEAEKLTAQELAEKRAADAEARAEAAEAKAKQAELKAMRANIGTAKGLPPEFAALLQGDDEAALTLHADKLIAALPKQAAPGARPGEPPAEDTDPVLKGLFGKE